MVEALDFFSVNRFLLDALWVCEQQKQQTLSALSDFLQISSSTLRNHLQKWRMPTKFRALFNLAAQVADKIATPPHCYTAFQNLPRDQQFDQRSLELFLPVAPYHFDHVALLRSRSNFDISPNFLSVLEESLDPTPTIPERFQKSSDLFRQEMDRLFSAIPGFIRSVNPDIVLRLNNDLSLIHLYGKVLCERPGIDSPHLHGTFTLAMRQPGTGYLRLDSRSESQYIRDPELPVFFRWLQEHNPLYSDQDSLPNNPETFRFTLGAIDDKQASIVIPGMPERDITASRVPVIYRQDDRHTPVYVTVETALALSFPILFPLGPIPMIPGRTLRDKAQCLLSSHSWFCCGRLACSMILWLYNIIEEHDTGYYNRHITYQPLQIPHGVTRDIPPTARPADPTGSSYWSHKQKHVRAMAKIYGQPDLMITFTYNNQWPEAQYFLSDARQSLSNHKIDMSCTPLDTMAVWHRRFAEAKEESFRPLIQAMGLGTATHFMWRLEFQMRGAPHVHLLIWLESRMSLEHVGCCFFALPPPVSAVRLGELVRTKMQHGCTSKRCKRGVQSANCRYGFPKPVTATVHYDANDTLQLPRDENSRLTVEYNPFLLLYWHGHCHVHVLRTREKPSNSDNAMHYILKYNFKKEPNVRVSVAAPNNPKFATFQARVISVEEAVARIFGMNFTRSDVASVELSLRPHESEVTAFRDGQQIQMTDIEKYFHRPPELENMGILNFFSFYDITPQDKRHQGRYATHTPRPEVRYRPPQTLAPGSEWERDNFPPVQLIEKGELYTCTELPGAQGLGIRLRVHPRIVITEKFLGSSINHENFAFLKLLLSGCWRSQEEMIGHCESWREALAYHGVTLDDSLESYERQLLDYMIDSPIYSDAELLRNFGTFQLDVGAVLSEILTTQDDPRIRSLWDQWRIGLEGQDSPIEDINAPPDGLNLNEYAHITFSLDEKEAARHSLTTITGSLNDEQKHCYTTVTMRLGEGIQTNAFIAGKAGTGKSFLIQAFRSFLEANSIPHVVCASTGIAASLISGRTLHSAFQLFSADQGETTICGLDISRPNGLAISRIRVCIIDEITMISSGCLDAIDQGLQKLMSHVSQPHRHLPFGGVSLLLFGDLAQVPAVVRNADDYNQYRNQFVSSLHYESFLTFQLRQQMRQTPGELDLLRILDACRTAENGHLPEDIQDILRQRFLPTDTQTDGFHAVSHFIGDSDGLCIAFTNRAALAYNKYKINQQRVEGAVVHELAAMFYIRPVTAYCGRESSSTQDQIALCTRQPATQKQISIYRRAIQLRKTSCLVPFTLQVAIGSKVMLLKNLSFREKLINGARGVVTSLDITPDGHIHSIWGLFNGQEEPHAITRRICDKYVLDRGDTIELYQFPLTLAWAVTAHKAQGQTLERVAINVGEEAFAHGAFYVALSRVRHLSDILLYGCSDWPEDGPGIHNNPFIQDEMIRLNTDIHFSQEP